MNCQRCGRTLDGTAIFCAGCGSMLTRSPDRPVRSAWEKAVIAVLVGVAFVGSLAWLLAVKGQANDPAIRERERLADLKLSACYAAKGFVERRLKAPSTAKFPNCYDVAVADYSRPDYTMTLAVDAQNSFGAMLRNRYLITVRDEGANWRLVSLQDLSR